VQAQKGPAHNLQQSLTSGHVGPFILAAHVTLSGHLWLNLSRGCICSAGFGITCSDYHCLYHKASIGQVSLVLVMWA
jgi:hypothetical protein